MVVWLIGLSGAGKSTIGSLLYQQVAAVHSNTVYLDGDVLRDVWGDTLGHDIEGRRLNAHRLSHLSSMLHAQGIHVVAAVLSIFPEWQTWNRSNISDYFEIFLDVPMDVVYARDTKGLYRRAKLGEIDNVVGVDIPFTRPPASDLNLVPPDVLEAPSFIVERILAEPRLREGFDL